MSKTYSLLFVCSIIIVCLLKTASSIGSATQGTASIDLTMEKVAPAFVQKELSNKVKTLAYSKQTTTVPLEPSGEASTNPKGSTSPSGNTTPTTTPTATPTTTPTATPTATPTPAPANSVPLLSGTDASLNKPITADSTGTNKGNSSSYINAFLLFSMSLFAFILF